MTNHISDPNSDESISKPNICEEPELVTEYLTVDFVKDSLAMFFPNEEKENSGKTMINEP